MDQLISLVIMLVMFFLASAACKPELLHNERDRRQNKKAA
jgi:hypothetical protein